MLIRTKGLVAWEVLRECESWDGIPDRDWVKVISGSRKAGAKAKHRDNHKKQNSSRYLVVVWLPLGARGPGWVFVGEAGELSGTRLRSSTAWLTNFVIILWGMIHAITLTLELSRLQRAFPSYSVSTPYKRSQRQSGIIRDNHLLIQLKPWEVAPTF